MGEPQYFPISRSEAEKTARTGRPEADYLDTYRKYVRDLQPDSAGKLVLTSEHKAATIRHRLLRAAAELNLELAVRVRDKERVVLFWLKDPEAGSEATPRKARSRAKKSAASD